MKTARRAKAPLPQTITDIPAVVGSRYRIDEAQRCHNASG
jgi:hypothetical protein